MVEEWINTSSYKNYYAACNPGICIYSLKGKNKIIVVISTTIGLLGSLTTILSIVVPVVARKIRSCFKKCADKTLKQEELGKHPYPRVTYLIQKVLCCICYINK